MNSGLTPLSSQITDGAQNTSEDDLAHSFQHTGLAEPGHETDHEHHLDIDMFNNDNDNTDVDMFNNDNDNIPDVDMFNGQIDKSMGTGEASGSGASKRPRAESGSSSASNDPKLSKKYTRVWTNKVGGGSAPTDLLPSLKPTGRRGKSDRSARGRLRK